jgi:hypothetical protein
VTVVAAARVVTGEVVHAPGWVEYERGRIVAVGSSHLAALAAVRQVRLVQLMPYARVARVVHTESWSAHWFEHSAGS